MKDGKELTKPSERQCRYFNVNLSASITKTGQLAIRWIQRKLNELVNKETGIEKDRIVLIDTDSVVLDLEDLVAAKCPEEWSREQKLNFINEYGEKVIEPYIGESYKELSEYCNHYKPKLHMKRENIVNAMVNLAKKSYIMEVWDSEGVRFSLENPKMKIMGIQAIKSSTCKPVKDALMKMIPIMLHGKESDVPIFVEKFKKEFFALPVEQIAFPRSVSSIDQFKKSVVKDRLYNATGPERDSILASLESGSDLYIKGTPINSKAALVYNYMLEKCGIESQYNKITNSDKLKFVYLKKQNPIHEEVVGFRESLPAEFGLQEYVDYEMMFKKSFISLLEGMIEPLGWSWEHKSTSLADLFV